MNISKLTQIQSHVGLLKSAIACPSIRSKYSKSFPMMSNEAILLHSRKISGIIFLSGIYQGLGRSSRLCQIIFLPQANETCKQKEEIYGIQLLKTALNTFQLIWLEKQMLLTNLLLWISASAIPICATLP